MHTMILSLNNCFFMFSCSINKIDTFWLRIFKNIGMEKAGVESEKREGAKREFVWAVGGVFSKIYLQDLHLVDDRRLKGVM